MNRRLKFAIASLGVALLACGQTTVVPENTAIPAAPSSTPEPTVRPEPTVTASPTAVPDTPTPAPTPTVDPAAQLLEYGKKAVTGVGGGQTSLYAFYGDEGDTVTISAEIVNTRPNAAGGFCAKAAPDALLKLTTKSSIIDGTRQVARWADRTPLSR